MPLARKALESCLEGLPFVEATRFDIRPVQYEARPDMLVQLALPDGQAFIVAEVKTSGEPRIARAAADAIARTVRIFPRAYGVFVAPFISPAAAEIVQQNNIGYLDLAGNCRLSFWPVHIERQGNPNPFARRRSSASLFTPKTARVMRVLLINSNRTWRVADLAQNAGVSLGLVSNVRQLLADREWIEARRGALRLTRPFELLSEWTANYDSRRDIANDFYCLKPVNEIESGLIEVCSREGAIYAFTGFSAGARLAPAVRYHRVAAYTSQEALTSIISELELTRVPSGANVTLTVPNDVGVYYGASEIDSAMVVSDVQAYLDLRRLHGRGDEAAEAILKRMIEPRWR